MSSNQGELAVLDVSGDTKTIWDRTRSDEVAAARKVFDDLRKKGYSAYSVRPDGSKDMLITEFNPDLEKIILAPRIVGG